MESTARIKSLTIGRAPENDISISDHRISRKHAKLEISGGVCTLVDLNSTNGTYVNGSQVSRHSLQPGDRVELAGGVSFQWYKYMPTQQFDHRQTQQMEGRETQPREREMQNLHHGPRGAHSAPRSHGQGGHHRDQRNGYTKQFKPKKGGLVFICIVLPIWFALILGPGGLIVGGALSVFVFLIQRNHRNLLAITSNSFELKLAPFQSKKIISFGDIASIEFNKNDKLITIRLKNNDTLKLKKRYFKKGDWQEVINCFGEISHKV